MNRAAHRPARLFAPWALRLGLALALAACDKQGTGTDTPGADDPGSRMEGKEGGVGTTAPGVDGKPAQPAAALPSVRDRDPEEEKRKMARSRAQSAKAEAALTGGRLDPAIEAAREALRLHEQNVHAMLIIAEAYFRQGKYEIVQAVITSALAVDPKIRTPAETSRLYNLQGFALLAMGKDPLATQSFKKAAENDDKNASAWNNLGTRYLEAGDVKTARSCFAYAVDLDARFYKAHLNLGAAQRAESQWKEAEASFLTALRLKPSYPEAYFDLGILYLDADPFPGLDSAKRLNKAISYLTKYRELASSSTSTRPKPKGTAAHVDPPAATREIADDYIRVAKKGLERLQRDAERDKTKGAAGDGGATPASSDTDASAPAGAAKPAAQPASPDPAPTGTATPSAPPPDKPSEPSKPSSSAPPPSKPNTPPSAPAPSKPAPSKPAPSKPAPSKPAPSKPQSPAAPPSSPPPQAPPASPPPANKPSPTPVAPSPAPPPQPVKPTPVAPQKPTPQKPPASSGTAALLPRAAPTERAFGPNPNPRPTTTTFGMRAATSHAAHDSFTTKKGSPRGEPAA